MKHNIEEISLAIVKSLLTDKNLLEFNREIKIKHVSKMQRSIVECGVLRLPVIGDVSSFDSRRRVIVDGQHLCKAIASLPKEHSMSKVTVLVKKYISKKQLIDDISKLNNTQKTWTDTNYLEAWFKYGKDNYTYYDAYNKLYSIYNNPAYSLPCGLLVEIYSKSKDKFRQGSLVFYNEKFSDKLLDLCNNLKVKYNKGSFALHGLIMWANEHKESKINWDKLRSRINRAISLREDVNCQGREDFRDFVSRTYNRV